MALGKSVPGKFGPPVAYWRLVSVHHDIDALTTALRMYGYPDKAASDARATPMDSIDFIRTAANVAAMDGLTFAQIYTYVKAQGFFAGATDV